MKAALTLLLTLGFAMSAASAGPRFRDYQVRPGDTGHKISMRLFGDLTHWEMIRAANEGLTEDKDAPLDPGQILRIPHAVAVKRFDARITHVSKVVEARRNKQEAWRRAREGQELLVGARVSTREQSAAELTFKDKSVVQMRADSLLIIYGESAKDTRRVSRARLQRGALRSRLGALSGKRLEVQAGGVAAELSTGQAVIAATEDGGSAISQHSGKAAKVKTKKGRRVRIKPGMGVRVRKGKPSKPKRLPPTPQWMKETPRQIAAPVQTGGTLHARFERVKRAARYQVELTLDAKGGMLIQQLSIPGDQNHVKVGPLPVGRYYVWISAIDKDGLESPRSEALPLTLQPLRFRAPGRLRAPTATGDPVPPPMRVIQGTRMLAPPRARCRVQVKGGASTALARTTPLSQPGRVEARCEGDDGSLYPRLHVEVEPLEIKPLGDPLLRGRQQEVVLRLDGGAAALPERLAIRDGKRLRHLKQDVEGHWRTRMEIPPKAAPQIWRPLVALDPEGGEVRLGRVYLDTVEPPPPPPLPRVPLIAHTGAYDPRLSGAGAPDERGHEATLGVAPTLADAPSGRAYLDGALQLTDAYKLHLSLPVGVDEGGLQEGGDGRSARLGLSFTRWRGVAFGADASLPLATGDGISDARIVPRVDLSWETPHWATRVRQSLWIGADIGGLFNTVGVAEWFLPAGLSVGVEANALLGQKGLDDRTRELRLGLPLGWRGDHASILLVPSAPHSLDALTLLLQGQYRWGR